MSMSRGSVRQSRTVIFLGLSGSGKDTQARLLLRALPRGRNVSTGDSLRKIAAKQNFLGRCIKRILDRGGLVPYWGAAHTWLADFFAHLRVGENLVFSGSPRTRKEARLLDDVMRDTGRPLPMVIYLKLAPAAARRRLIARSRADDRPQAIAGRFAYFRRDVRPVIAYYRRRGRLIVINGDQTVPAVWRDIRRALELS